MKSLFLKYYLPNRLVKAKSKFKKLWYHSDVFSFWLSVAAFTVSIATLLLFFIS